MRNSPLAMHDSSKVAHLISWLRHASLETVMDEAAQKLKQGVSEDELWAACTLTACRYRGVRAGRTYLTPRKSTYLKVDARLLPAIDHKTLACDHPGGIGSQINSQRRHFLGLDQPRERLIADEEFSTR
jgi:hypothetical protein